MQMEPLCNSLSKQKLEMHAVFLFCSTVILHSFVFLKLLAIIDFLWNMFNYFYMNDFCGKLINKWVCSKVLH